ncbi:MAG TPA: peptidase [Allosphingosinicella sp.]|nr:peptidase [Allosphingosinicella sp.]
MTYCIGLLLNQGLVMIADTRTNAGVDNFSSYKKLHTLESGPDRQIYACTSGSLSMSQSVISLIMEGLPATDGGEMSRTLGRCTTMFRVAQLVGEAVQTANRTVGAALEAINLSSSVSLLVGGRIGKNPPQLFQVYSAGNFIQGKSESPFLQIGETKYGKPILDRGIEIDMPLDEAVKVAFLSFDSAMRSNLGVARPLDMIVMPRDPKAPVLARRIEPDDEYFNELSMRWAILLHEATRAIPNPPFMQADGKAVEVEASRAAE